MSSSVCVAGEGHSWSQAEREVWRNALHGQRGVCWREGPRSTRSFSREVAPSFSLAVTGAFNYPFSPSLTIGIAAPPGLISWRWAMALLNSAMYQMSGTGAVTAPAFVWPASNPHCTLLPVRIQLGKTLYLGQRLTYITQCWPGEARKRKQEAKDLIRKRGMQQITHMGTSSSCQRSPVLPQLPSITAAWCSRKTLQEL